MKHVEAWCAWYPFDSHYVYVDGQRYHYVDEGRGDVLLFVHGNPTWSFYWRNLITHFRGACRAIAPDHIGCGLSDKPQQYAYRLATHVANLEHLIEHLDLREITLVAHDWGGAIGLGAAVNQPWRFARLVLMNTAAFRSRRMPLRIRACRTPILGRLAVQGLNGFLRAALRMAMADPDRLAPAIRAGYLAPYDSWPHRVAIQRFVEDIPLHPAHPSYKTLRSIEERLGQVAHLPTLLMWGMRDWCFTPHFLERFQTFFPQAEVERIETAGHWLVEDAPLEVTRRLETFLDAHPIPHAEGG